LQNIAAADGRIEDVSEKILARDVKTLKEKILARDVLE
jgi:hypothetical protein